MKKLIAGLLTLVIFSHAQVGLADSETESLAKVIAKKRAAVLKIQGQIIKKKNEVTDVLNQLNEAENEHSGHASKAYITLLASGASIIASVALFKTARRLQNNAVGFTSIGFGLFGVTMGVTAGLQKYWAHASLEQVEALKRGLAKLNKELDAYNAELSNDLAILMAADQSNAEKN